MPYSENPFRQQFVTRATPEPCTIVIFGATGDLTHRKLIPALYSIAANGELPPTLKVIGFARREKDDETFRNELEAANRKHARAEHDDALWGAFRETIHYHRGEFQNLDDYRALADELNAIDGERGSGNRLFYLASAPEFFDDILTNLRASGLNKAPAGSWARIVVEKPFGTDLPSARKLNKIVSKTFHERDTFRIDHYLGKETAQNIMVLRFANAIFEPQWNNRYIDSVQITCAENLGMEGGRGGYYDKSGALRDMVQNHLLQLLSLVAMEPPTDLSADGIRDEKVKIIRSLRPISGADVAASVVRAQYAEGTVDGKTVPGYRQEDRVNPQSMTESFVALKILVDTWRWEGVPFHVRMGKQLPKKATEISVHFKYPPSVLFNSIPMQGDLRGNVLVIRIQPDEGISLRMLSKIPGAALRMEPVKMDFHYSTSFGKASPEAYERLLLDAIAGDATLFARRDEVEHAWEFIDAIENAWHSGTVAPPMATYPAGTWGPREADDLLERDGRSWRRL